MLLGKTMYSELLSLLVLELLAYLNSTQKVESLAGLRILYTEGLPYYKKIGRIER